MKTHFFFAMAALGVAGSVMAQQAPVNGRFVRVEIKKDKATLSLAEVQVFSKGENVALKGKATQSDTAHGAAATRAIDGNTDTKWGGGSITHTPEDRKNPWWEVDLGAEKAIDKIMVWNREEIPQRLDGAAVIILGEDRKVKWEQVLTRPNPTSTELAVDARVKPVVAERKIERKIEPATDNEVRAAYTKQATWLETILATQAKLEAFRNLSPVMGRLMEDFPADAADIQAEYHTWIHGKQSGAISEMAERYAREIPAHVRGDWQQRAKAMKTVEELTPLRAAYREGKDQMLKLTFLQYFNAEAMERAIKGYAAKYPAVYKDKDALLARLAEVAPVAEAAAKGSDMNAKFEASKQVEALMDAVYMKHPGVDFKEMLMVRRSKMSHRGLPANWQGNSSIPLHGYVNDVVRVPVKQAAGANPQVVYASDSFVGDVNLHFDADRIAFASGKKGEKGWRIFETRLDAPGVVKELTPPDMPDIDFYDPCYLPDGRMLFVATSGFHGVPCVTGSDYVGNTHLMEKDGSIRRIVFDQDNSWCPVVMNNGRVLYLRWEYTDSAHYFARVIMTMNPDGSDQQEFYGSNSYWPNSLFYARPLPGSVTKFAGIVSGHHGHARMGELVLFDAAKGRRETDGVIQRIPGYGKPVENVTKDGLANNSKPLFLHPFPLSDELFLVSMHENSGGPFFIALADIYDNFVPLWQSVSDHLLEPRPLKKQPKPVLPVDRYRPGEKDCLVYMVGADVGPGLEDIPKGKVKKLRVFEYVYSPRNTGGHYHIGFEGPWDARVILGTVDVESDGSCMFKAPANTPIAVQPLDANGNTLQQMRSWFVGVPGETITCVGCHDRQNAAPPTGASVASRKKAQEIQPWYGPRRSYAFEREVQPVLDQACIGCHNSKTVAKNKLGQPVPNFETTPSHDRFSTAYLSLHPYIRRNGPEGDYHLLTPLEFHADTSELVQMLKKGHHNVKLNPEQWDRLFTWIDLNVPFWGSWSERDGERVAKQIQRRKEMAKLWGNIDFDPEEIVNPYTPGTFTPPPQQPAAAFSPPPTVKGFPFDNAAAKAMQGAGAFKDYDLGDGQKLTFSRIPQGAFVMGSADETPAEAPQHEARIAKPFWMATTPVTQAQMKQFDPAFENGVYDMHYKDQVDRGYFMKDPDFPAIRVSWEQANAYCAWLSKKIGKTVRLPTEAQWEWACRAGTATPMNYGGFDADFSAHENFADHMFIELAVTGVDPKPIAKGNDPNPAKLPSPLWDYELRDRRFNDGALHLAKVASYAPNAWGLHDMHGNAAEWTRSSYKPYPYKDDAARNNAAIDDMKVVRGGSWYRRPHVSTSSWRWRYPGWMRPFDVGFRVVIED
ncbi:MAG: SUMF1/EgtB/PvdO family nonheme iron enzyme [Kiritimatiellaeota bacterium]|nr:SUMF1/EgtB/PvdO family nonheme iron enzyme [Kiritimatiellota bacterium]